MVHCIKSFLEIDWMLYWEKEFTKKTSKTSLKLIKQLGTKIPSTTVHYFGLKGVASSGNGLAPIGPFTRVASSSVLKRLAARIWNSWYKSSSVSFNVFGGIKAPATDRLSMLSQLNVVTACSCPE